jgi:hypothetical protein
MKRSLLTLLLTWGGLAATAEDLIPVDGEAESRPVAYAYLVTSSRSASTTAIHLMNTSDDPAFFAGTLFNRHGKQLGDSLNPLTEDAVAPKGRIIITPAGLETRFKVTPWAGPALLQVTGSSSFQLMTKLTSPSGIETSSNCVTEGSVHNIRGEGSAGNSWVRLINTGDKSIAGITGTLYQVDGSVIGQEETLLTDSLASHQGIFLSRDQLMDIFRGSWTGEASLFITSDAPGLKLLNLNIQNRTFTNHSCLQEARATPTITNCDEPRPQACTMEFDPVCAQRDTGIRCVTAPCDSIEWQTYSNGCTACSDPLVFGHYKESCEDILSRGN